MQIKEVQEKLKISSYTLRYYEKMGLIQPYRDENGYRNYNEEDIHKIERIMFLRDINVPIEAIKDILDNKVTFQDVLENHIEKVNTQIESLQYIKNMCEDLKEKNIPLLDQVIEDNQIGDEKVKKRDLKKVFDYFKKDQTVIIGTRFDLNMYFRTFIYALITAPMLTFVAINYLQRFHILEKGIIDHIFIYLILIILVILLSIVSISYMCSRQNYIELTDNKISILDAKKVSHLKLSYLVLKRDLTTIMENYSWEDLEYVEIKLVIKYGGIGIGTSKTMYYYLPNYIFHFKDATTKSFLEWNNPKAAYQILRNKNIEIVTNDEMLDCFEQKELSVYDFFENIYHKNGKNR